MVHCRSPVGAWEHAQRSFKRGCLARPPVFYGVELPPPLPPPVSYGVELPGPRVRLNWNELCEECDDRLELLENDCPSGVVTFLVDAPLAVKDISLPKTFCLSVLLEPDAETSPEVSIASQALLEPDAGRSPE